MTTPFTILPGWCLGQGPLRSTASALNANILDLPGHGGQALTPSFDDAVALLAAQLPPAGTLCGWSLGAMLALAIAARFPEKAARLVLIAGTASFVARPNWPHGMPPEQLAQFSAAAEADIETLLPRFVGNFSRGDTHAKSVMRTILDRADPRPSAATLSVGLAWLRDVDLRPRLSAVRCPTLLVHGAADPLMPLSAATALTNALPDARLVALDGCAHAPFLSDPNNFMAAVRGFSG